VPASSRNTLVVKTGHYLYNQQNLADGKIPFGFKKFEQNKILLQERNFDY